jgi:hypothetical protein
MARVGRSIIIKIKLANGKTTSSSIDETLADLFCIKSNNILCDGAGVTLLRAWSEAKIKQYDQGSTGVSAFLRHHLLLELVDDEIVNEFQEQDYKRVLG